LALGAPPRAGEEAGLPAFKSGGGR